MTAPSKPTVAERLRALRMGIVASQDPDDQHSVVEAQIAELLAIAAEVERVARKARSETFGGGKARATLLLLAAALAPEEEK